MKNEVSRVPVLIYNTGRKDREACRLVLSAKMPCEFIATAEENTPRLIYNYRQFLGFEEIRSFVDKWQRRQIAL